MEQKPITIPVERRIQLMWSNFRAEHNHVMRQLHAEFPELLGEYVPLPAIRIAAE
jgi:hypothetical protein